MSIAITSNPITLRDIGPEDEGFLSDLYASTRAEETASWGWDDAQLTAFFKMQFNAQQRSYEQQFPGADHRIIMRDGLPIGRIIVYRSTEETRLVDISLLPAHRGGGIGSALIKSLLAEARESNRPVRLRVERSNRARRLYERMGFVGIGETASHLHMEWRS